MREDNRLLNLEAKLKYIFNDKSLLKMALTHKSYAYEHINPDYDKYNERIEFLGDAILEHIISDLLFAHRPELSEGEMTKKRAAIVCEASLSTALKRIGGQEYIYLGKCERNSNGMLKDAIIADAFEAILGAIYLDGGYDIARDICLELLDKEIKTKHSNIEAAKELGALIAKKAKAKKIEEVVFDRGGYIYHGVVKELAEAAREGGLKF